MNDKLLAFEHPDGDKDLREELRDMYESSGNEIRVLEPGYLDEAVIGIDTCSDRLVYSADLLVRVYVKEYMQASAVADLDEAYEMAEDQVYNDTVPSCVDPESPVIMIETVQGGRFRDALASWLSSLKSGE